MNQSSLYIFLLVRRTKELIRATRFVMESLNIFPDLLLPPTSDASANIDLADLENALSRMTAIEIWAGKT